MAPRGNLLFTDKTFFSLWAGTRSDCHFPYNKTPGSYELREENSRLAKMWFPFIIVYRPLRRCLDNGIVDDSNKNYLYILFFYNIKFFFLMYQTVFIDSVMERIAETFENEENLS